MLSQTLPSPLKSSSTSSPISKDNLNETKPDSTFIISSIINMLSLFGSIAESWFVLT